MITSFTKNAVPEHFVKTNAKGNAKTPSLILGCLMCVFLCVARCVCCVLCAVCVCFALSLLLSLSLSSKNHCLYVSLVPEHLALRSAPRSGFTDWLEVGLFVGVALPRIQFLWAGLWRFSSVLFSKDDNDARRLCVRYSDRGSKASGFPLFRSSFFFGKMKMREDLTCSSARTPRAFGCRC